MPVVPCPVLSLQQGSKMNQVSPPPVKRTGVPAATDHRTFRIHCTNGVIIDVSPLPPDFNFAGTCMATRANGYFLLENVYVNEDMIQFFEFVEPGKAGQRIMAAGTDRRQ